MRYSFLSVLILLSIANPASSQTSPYRFEVDAPQAPRVTVKRGWNLLTNTPTASDCVTGAVSAPGEIETVTEIGQFKDNSTLAKGFGISGAAQARFLIGSADAEASYLLSHQASSETFSVALRGRARQTVSLQPSRVPGGNTSQRFVHDAVALTPFALKLAKQDNLSEFRKACGDGFVAAVVSGADLVGLGTATVRTLQDEQKLTGMLRGSILGQKAQVDVNQFIKEFASHTGNVLTFRQFGGKPAAVPVTTEGLIKALEGLQQSLATPTDAKDFTLTIFRYGPETVANWPSGAPETNSPVYTLIDQMMLRFWRYRALLDQATEIQARPQDYIYGWGTTPETVANVKAAALTATQQLETAAKTCIEKSVCTPPALASDVYGLSAQLPLRHNWNAEQAEMGAAYQAAVDAVNNYNNDAAIVRNSLNALYSFNVAGVYPFGKDPTGFIRNKRFNEEFSQPRYRDVVAPAILRLRQATAAFGAALLRDLREVRVRSIHRLRCQNALDEGCISEREADGYAASVPFANHIVDTNFGPGNTVLSFTGEPGLVRWARQ